MSINFKSIIITVLLVLVAVQPVIATEIKPVHCFLKSLLVPGWGELSVGSKTGYIFITTEIALWASKYYFLEEEDLANRRAYEFALVKGNIAPGDYSETFWNRVSIYNSSGYEPGGYGEVIRKRAFELYPFDIEERRAYEERYALDNDEYWQWGDEETRKEYRRIKVDEMDYADYAKLMTGIIVANHIVSGINALRSARRKKNKFEVGVRMNKEYTPMLTGTYKF